MDEIRTQCVPWMLAVAVFSCATLAYGAEGDLAEQVRELQRQNERLTRQLRDQQVVIDDLGRKMEEIRRPLSNGSAAPVSYEEPAAPAKPLGPLNLGKVNLGGEGGVAFFRSEAKGKFPNSEFRVDEAKLFVEAPVWKDVYFFTELNITTREEREEYMRVGELYVDFENLSRLWNRDGQLNLRVGRFDIPFGEEYLVRDAIDNPLISHSLSDLWGVDEGVELYGQFGQLRYVLAAQNGGHPTLRDYNEDKALAARVSYDPAKWLHVSGSAMRTGALDVEDDFLSELWFGNGFIRSLGAPESTTTFQANVFEGDVHVLWKRGHVKGAGGYLQYDDNDGAANNRREVYYYYVEGLQHIGPKFYAASRWSQILAHKGFPLVGDGKFTQYQFYDLSTELWRWSLGVGYRWSPNLVLKAEYTFEEGQTLDGEKRNHLNRVAAEVAFRF